MKRLVPLLVVAVALVAFITLAIPGFAQARRAPLVLAFYYNWYDENTWKTQNVPDMPTLKYLSRDPINTARQIVEAREAGIDSFIVSWWGPGNPTDFNFKAMLDQARGLYFPVGIDIEINSPFFHNKNDVVNALKYLQSTHMQHPAYLRVDGKPVLFFWREQIYSVDEWVAIRNNIDPQRKQIWIAEGIDETYQRVFDGHHLYMVAWSKNVRGELNKWPPRIKKFGADKIWVATVNPGADNRKTTQPEKVVRDRENGAFYREMWQAAFSTYPDWIMITSWNEWAEGTMIEPSVTYGNLYLDITREYAAKYKAGLPTPTPTPTRTATPTRTSTPTATFTPTVTPTPEPTATPEPTSTLTPVVTADAATTAAPATSSASASPAPAKLTVTPKPTATIQIQARVSISGTLRVRAAPMADAEILGRLVEGAGVTLLARSEDNKWWQIAFPNLTKRGWISADLVTPNGDTLTLPIMRVETRSLDIPPPRLSMPIQDDGAPSLAEY
ncbi:MAG: glycoside hydrolase family 99-like domain-containing protein [Chloroflexi bacterium]|nr:glycoside hydrolase family 99-like domain-containing protein [Chloroflexota bacterium]